MLNTTFLNHGNPGNYSATYSPLAPLNPLHSPSTTTSSTKFPPLTELSFQFTSAQGKSQNDCFQFVAPQPPHCSSFHPQYQHYHSQQTQYSQPSQPISLFNQVLLAPVGPKPHLPPLNLFSPSAPTGIPTEVSTPATSSSNILSPNYSNPSKNNCTHSSCSSSSSNCSSPISSSSPFLSLYKSDAPSNGQIDYTHLTHHPAHAPNTTSKHFKSIDNPPYCVFPDRYSSDIYAPAAGPYNNYSVQQNYQQLLVQPPHYPAQPSLLQPQPYLLAPTAVTAAPSTPASSMSTLASPNVTVKQPNHHHLFQRHQGNSNSNSNSNNADVPQPKPRKQPNWAEFYKNGYPSEIIVISDDEDEAGNETVVVATKRKRKVTPHTTLKKLCHDISYSPPSRPIVKVREVQVPRVRDSIPDTSDSACDDADGHLVIKPTTTLADGRFKVDKVLGQGTFGKVVSAYDVKNKVSCAVKIIRAVPKYRDASKIELRVLTTLAVSDPKNRQRFIHLRECFDYKDHICIVTDLLGMSIFDFLKSNKYLAFPASHVQSFAKQLLSSVAYLHNLGLVHTDLKPENILLRDSTSYMGELRNHPKYTTRRVLNDTRIHLIDFGSAVFNDEYHNSVVSTRHYRAPEIILDVGWSFPCDIWSIGCILVEFCTGEALFQTHDNLEHLALMQRVIGKPVDRRLLHQARMQKSSGAELLNAVGKINYPNSTTKKGSEKHVQATRLLAAQLNCNAIPHMSDASPMFWESFLDLLNRIFEYDPLERITAREALDHPWLKIPVNGV